jgi:hypothetical protein
MSRVRFPKRLLDFSIDLNCCSRGYIRGYILLHTDNIVKYLTSLKTECNGKCCNINCKSIIMKQKVLFTVNITRNRMQNPIIKCCNTCYAICKVYGPHLSSFGALCDKPEGLRFET